MPALVGLRLKSPYLKVLSGLRTEATVEIPELSLVETGEIIFTDYGVSGIPVFDLTRAIGPKQRLTLRLRLAPESPDLVSLEQALQERQRLLAHKTASDALIGFLPRQLIVPVLKEAHLPPDRSTSSLGKMDIGRLAQTVWAWDFSIVGLNTWEQAQTTFGGVRLNEVHPNSLESGHMAGLYFAGELLDVHGRCGGYNLHWAWASGYVAGTNAGRK